VKNLSPKHSFPFVLSAMLLLVFASPSIAQRERPSKFASESATKALRDFNTAEQDLAKKRETKTKEIEKIFEERHGTIRGQLVTKLKKRLVEETKNGKLDAAVGIRSAISYFEKLKPSDPPGLRGQPRKLSSASANQAMKSFMSDERALIKKRDEKNKQLDKYFKQTHGELRDVLVAELSKSLAEQTAAGELDGALEIRSAVSYFSKMKLGEVTVESAEATTTEVKPAEKAVAKPAEKTRADKSKLTNSIGMKLQLIPPGEFLMGSETESDALVKAFRWKGENQFPQHKVTITKPFYMGAYEVRVRDFKEFVAATGHKTMAEKSKQGGQGYDGNSRITVNRSFTWKNVGFEQDDDHPVVNVTWFDAFKFCEWLSSKEKVTYKLPSEAQWEYACRAGSKNMYYNGNETESLTSIANMADTSWRKKLNKKKSKVTTSDDCVFTNRVGQYLPNQFGLYDMTGNVSEFCHDWFQDYDQSAKVDPVGPEQGEKRVARGGGWRDNPFGCRTAARVKIWPTVRGVALGFRVVRVASQ